MWEETTKGETKAVTVYYVCNPRQSQFLECPELTYCLQGRPSNWRGGWKQFRWGPSWFRNCLSPCMQANVFSNGLRTTLSFPRQGQPDTIARHCISNFSWTPRASEASGCLWGFRLFQLHDHSALGVFASHFCRFFVSVASSQSCPISSMSSISREFAIREGQLYFFLDVEIIYFVVKSVTFNLKGAWFCAFELSRRS